MRHTVHIFVGDHLKEYALKVHDFLGRYDNLRDNGYLQIFQISRHSDNEFSIESPNADVSGKTIATDEQYADWLSSLHGTTVTTDSRDIHPDLYVCLYIPLYERKCWEEALHFFNLAKFDRHQFTVDIFGLNYDLRQIIDDSTTLTSNEAASEAATVVKEIKSAIDGGLLHRFVFLQNTNRNQKGLNMDSQTLSNILGEYSMLVTDSYASIFPPNEELDKHEVSVLGISALWFEKDYFVNYLLKKAYVYALEREGVSETSVDINRIATYAKSLLTGRTDVYSDFNKKEIIPLIRGNETIDDIVSKLNERLEKEVVRLEKEFLSFVNERTLTLPEKQATLAQILGLDDELFNKELFNKNQPIIDDCMASAMSFFIDEDNQNVIKLKDDNGNPIVDENDNPIYVNGELTNSNQSGGHNVLRLNDIRRIRSKIKSKMSYIRDKSQELEDIEKGLQMSQESEKVLTSEGFSYRGIIYKPQDDSILKPLAETYTPEVTPLEEIDLRSRFSSVRDQGKLGSCTTFAATSIFEYYENRIRKAIDTRLSPLFVYYNVTHDEYGNLIDKGSSYYDVITSMGAKGVCEEVLYPYKDDTNIEPPSETAYDDASNRKILKAMNVEAKHQDITSALSAGYPVAISLRLFDSFCENNHGFIFHPTDEEISSSKPQWHAMVIVGYSKEAPVYIVRNSWGEKFGDNGYCYIPFSYIENQDLCRQACVITEINAGEITKSKLPRSSSASFNQTDKFIEYALLRIEIDREKIGLRQIQTEYELYTTAYKQHLIELGNPGRRAKIVDRALERRNLVILDQKEQYDTVVNKDRPVLLKEKRRTYRGVFFRLAGFFLASLVALVVGLTINADLSYIIIASVVAILLLISIFCLVPFYKTRYRRYKVELQENAEVLNRDIQKKEEEAKALRIQMFMAGRVIDEVCSMKRHIEEEYSKLKSYVSNLHQWLEEEKSAIGEMSPIVRDPFIGILDNATLDVYFDNNKDDVTKNIWLYEHLDDYAIQNDSIIKFRDETIRDILTRGLSDAVSDFSMFKYVTGATSYPYLQPANSLENTLNQLESKGQPFAENESISTDNIVYKNIYIHTESENEKKSWSTLYKKFFVDNPVGCAISTPNELVLCQIEVLKVDELSALKVG